MLIQIETLHTLSVLFFASICRISWVLTSANGKFFEFLNSAPKKNTVEPRDIRLFLSRSTEKQAGHHSYWLIIDLLLTDSKTSWIIFMHIFFVHFVKYEFCAYLACIYFCECRLKENFACISFYEIDQNSRKRYTREN